MCFFYLHMSHSKYPLILIIPTVYTSSVKLAFHVHKRTLQHLILHIGSIFLPVTLGSRLST